MERIPYILREKMTMDCVYLEKNRRGWDEIHKDLKTPYLYLRKTPYVFHDEFRFDFIIRANTQMYLTSPIKYTWLIRDQYNTYSYHPPHYYRIHELFSYGIVFDF